MHPIRRLVIQNRCWLYVIDSPPGLFFSAIEFDFPLIRDDAYHFVGGAALKGLIVGVVDRENV